MQPSKNSTGKWDMETYLLSPGSLQTFSHSPSNQQGSELSYSYEGDIRYKPFNKRGLRFFHSGQGCLRLARFNKLGLRHALCDQGEGIQKFPLWSRVDQTFNFCPRGPQTIVFYLGSPLIFPLCPVVTCMGPIQEGVSVTYSLLLRELQIFSFYLKALRLFECYQKGLRQAPSDHGGL